MIGNTNAAIARYSVTGKHFNKGILAALRAYPGIRSVLRSANDEKEQLDIEFDLRDKTMNVEKIVDVITRAGGFVESIQQVMAIVEHNEETAQ
jgi:hypothetical protein